MIALLLGGWAQAEDCIRLDEARLRSIVADAKAAVDRDDLVTFVQLRRTLIGDLPCLEGQLPVDAWARFLLDDAVVEFALGEAWKEPLATARSGGPSLQGFYRAQTGESSGQVGAVTFQQLLRANQRHCCRRPSSAGWHRRRCRRSRRSARSSL